MRYCSKEYCGCMYREPENAVVQMGIGATWVWTSRGAHWCWYFQNQAYQARQIVKMNYRMLSDHFDFMKTLELGVTKKGWVLQESIPHTGSLTISISPIIFQISLIFQTNLYSQVFFPIGNVCITSECVTKDCAYGLHLRSFHTQVFSEIWLSFQFWFVVPFCFCFCYVICGKPLIVFISCLRDIFSDQKLSLRCHNLVYMRIYGEESKLNLNLPSSFTCRNPAIKTDCFFLFVATSAVGHLHY